MTIRVLIADDHPIVRSGIRNELVRHPDIEIVGEAVNGDEACQMAEALQPDVLLLDINMPGMKAVSMTRRLQGGSSALHVLVLTAYGDAEYVLGMLRAGAEGYILKDEDPSVITEGIRAVVSGRIWLSAAVTQNVVGYSITKLQPVEAVLSAREFEVLQLLARGHSNTQIADKLVLAEGTVKNHVSSIYTKLGVNSRAEAVAWAWQNGIS